jgi:immune inhibitor A
MSAWAYIQDVGWRKVQTLTPEGVTNMFTLLVDAQAFNKKVNVYVDGSLIYQAYCE